MAGGGLEAGEDPNQGIVHGLDDRHLLPALAGLDQKRAVGHDLKRHGRPTAAEGQTVLAADGIPGGIVHHAGDRELKVPLKDHHGF